MRKCLLLWLIAVALFCVVDYAQAHDWYTSTHDPVLNYGCCGGHDCAPIDPGWVTETKDGYHIQMTVAQAMTVNPDTRLPIDTVVPWARVQTPPNAGRGEAFHACIRPTDRSPPEYGVICFFATPTM
jgi:hypothetical protein